MPTRTAAPQNFQPRPHPHLYEINTWTWLEQLSARLGKNINLAEVPDSEWDALAALGFNIVWLMGVWQRSPISRRMNVENPANVAQFSLALPGWKPSDVISSAYSVTAYAPDQRIGNWAALDDAREKLRARGIAIRRHAQGHSRQQQRHAAACAHAPRQRRTGAGGTRDHHRATGQRAIALQGLRAHARFHTPDSMGPDSLRPGFKRGV